MPSFLLSSIKISSLSLVVVAKITSSLNFVYINLSMICSNNVFPSKSIIILFGNLLEPFLACTTIPVLSIFKVHRKNLINLSNFFNKMKVYNSAIIGCGKMGSEFDPNGAYKVTTHAGAYKNTEDTNLVALCDT